MRPTAKHMSSRLRKAALTHQTEACRMFKEGKCKKGKDCKYSHRDGGGNQSRGRSNDRGQCKGRGRGNTPKGGKGRKKSASPARSSSRGSNKSKGGGKNSKNRDKKKVCEFFLRGIVASLVVTAEMPIPRAKRDPRPPPLPKAQTARSLMAGQRRRRRRVRRRHLHAS